MAAACKRLAQFSGFVSSKSFSFNSSLRSSFGLAKLRFIDTSAIVSRLEKQGVPTKQAEAITAAILEILNDSLENISESLMEKQTTEMQSSQMQLQHEIEKLRHNMEKRNMELRHKINDNEVAFKARMKSDAFLFGTTIFSLYAAGFCILSRNSRDSS